MSQLFQNRYLVGAMYECVAVPSQRNGNRTTVENQYPFRAANVEVTALVFFYFTVDNRPENFNFYFEERWDPRLELLPVVVDDAPLRPGSDICSLPIRRSSCSALLRELDEQFKGTYDGEPLQSRTMLMDAKSSLDNCRSMNVAFADSARCYHVACIWRKAYQERKSSERPCLLANVWGSTSAVLSKKPNDP